MEPTEIAVVTAIQTEVIHHPQEVTIQKVIVHPAEPTVHRAEAHTTEEVPVGAVEAPPVELAEVEVLQPEVPEA